MEVLEYFQTEVV